MARLISFDDDGEVELNETTINRSNTAVCRFPTAREQAQGITEASLALRRVEYKRLSRKKKKESSGNQSRG